MKYLQKKAFEKGKLGRFVFANLEKEIKLENTDEKGPLLTEIGDLEHLENFLQSNLTVSDQADQKVIDTALETLLDHIKSNKITASDNKLFLDTLMKDLEPILKKVSGQNKALGNLQNDFKGLVDWMLKLPEWHLAAKPLPDPQGNMLFNALRSVDLKKVESLDQLQFSPGIGLGNGRMDVNPPISGRGHLIQQTSRFSENYMRRVMDSILLYGLSGSATRKRFFDIFISSGVDPVTAQALSIFIGFGVVGLSEVYIKKVFSKNVTEMASVGGGIMRTLANSPIKAPVTASMVVVSSATMAAAAESVEAETIIAREMAIALGETIEALKGRIDSGTLTALTDYLSGDVNKKSQSGQASLLQQLKPILEKEISEGYLTGAKNFGQNSWIIMKLLGLKAQDVKGADLKISGYYEDPESYKAEVSKNGFSKKEKAKYERYQKGAERLGIYQESLNLSEGESILDLAVKRFDENFFKKFWGKSYKELSGTNLTFEKLEEIISSFEQKKEQYKDFPIWKAVLSTLPFMDLPTQADQFSETGEAKNESHNIEDSFKRAIDEFNSKDLKALQNIIQQIGTEGSKALKARGAKIREGFVTPDINLTSPTAPKFEVEKLFLDLDTRLRGIEQSIIDKGVSAGKITKWNKDLWSDWTKDILIGQRFQVVAAEKGNDVALKHYAYYAFTSALITFSGMFMGIPNNKRVGKENRQAVENDKDELRSVEDELTSDLYKSLEQALKKSLEDKNSPIFRLFYQLSPDGTSFKQVMELPTEYEVRRMIRRVMQKNVGRSLESVIMHKRMEDSKFVVNMEKMRYYLRENFHPTRSTSSSSSFSMDEVATIRETLQNVLNNPQTLEEIMNEFFLGEFDSLKSYYKNIAEGKPEKRRQEEVLDKVRWKHWKEKIVVANEEIILLEYIKKQLKKGKVELDEIAYISGKKVKGGVNEKTNESQAVETYLKAEILRARNNLQKAEKMLVEVLTDGTSPIKDEEQKKRVLERIIPSKDLKKYLSTFKKILKKSDYNGLDFAGTIQRSVLSTLEESVNATRIRKLEKIKRNFEQLMDKNVQDLQIEAPDYKLMVSLDRFNSDKNNNYKTVIRKYLKVLFLGSKIELVEKELAKGENGEDLVTFTKSLEAFPAIISETGNKLISEYEKAITEIKSGKLKGNIVLNFKSGEFSKK